MTDDDISSALILENLTTKFIGQRILFYPLVPSTMDVARQAARKGAAEGTIVLADGQTAGKGRLGRSWLSPPGTSIALSIILRPHINYLSRLTMLASLAVVRSIEEVTGLEPLIKWPNDVLIGGKKVCGILVDSEVRGSNVDFAIVGIGLNVNLSPHFFPEISAIATSLSAELGREVSRLRLLQRLLSKVEALYTALQQGESIHKEWQQRLETLGKEVRVSSGDRVEEGIAESVDADGNLMLRRPDGALLRIVAGDVTLRPQVQR